MLQNNNKISIELRLTKYSIFVTDKYRKIRSHDVKNTTNLKQK